MAVSTNNGLVHGPVHNLLVHFFTPGSSKIEVFEIYFFYIATTQYDHPRHVKHVLGRIYVFFTPFGYWAHEGGGGAGAAKGLVHNLPVRFFTPDSSKMEITTQRLLDRSHAGVYMGETPHTPPFLAFLGLFAYPTPRG